MLQSLRYITWSTLFVVLATTGCAQISKKAGVENRWRDQNLVLQEGVTTQQQVLAQLGPPSQIIALPAKTVFYYLFEETKGRLLFLIIGKYLSSLGPFDYVLIPKEGFET
jgi:outer membrane protein assembly factor BamE (lipoprotein component of BamABCDE complex)